MKNLHQINPSKITDKHWAFLFWMGRDTYVTIINEKAYYKYSLDEEAWYGGYDWTVGDWDTVLGRWRSSMHGAKPEELKSHIILGVTNPRLY